MMANLQDLIAKLKQDHSDMDKLKAIAMLTEMNVLDENGLLTNSYHDIDQIYNFKLNEGVDMTLYERLMVAKLN